MKNPEISIIIPVYNTEKYLRTCLDSVIQQTFREIEIICVDDGSTDNSFSILQEYAHKDKRISVITQTNQGQGAARNNGIKIATGNYIMFLDSDDNLETNACEILINKINENNVDIIFFGYNKQFNNISIPIKYSSFDQHLKNRKICLHDVFDDVVTFSRESWYKIYKKSFLILNNVHFLSTYRGAEDTPFWNKILTLNPSCVFIDETLYNYMIRSESSSGLVYSSRHYTDIFKTFKISNDIIINSNLEKRLKFQQLKANINWYKARYNNSDATTQKKILKLKKSLFKKYIKIFKKDSDLSFLIPLFKKSDNKFLNKIFSIKNSNKHKVFTILGIKIKFKRKKKSKKNEFYFNKEEIQPINKIKDDAITICFSSNNNFFEYLYVCIFSLIKHANKNNFYDIVILEKDITNANKNLIKKLENNHISIRFYNIKYIIENSNINFTISAHFAVENYFRLFIPLIFKSYNKVLYMDCDGVLLDDISQIYNENLENKFIGAVKDYMAFNDILSSRNINYYMYNLKLQDPFSYINSGVMLMDIQKLLDFNFSEKSFLLLNNFVPLYVDQCIINKILDGKCKFLPTKYNANFIYEYILELRQNKDNLPLKLKQELVSGRKDIVFIHYLTHLKPWKDPNVPMADVFWELAHESGMYERILYKNLGRGK